MRQQFYFGSLMVGGNNRIVTFPANTRPVAFTPERGNNMGLRIDFMTYLGDIPDEGDVAPEAPAQEPTPEEQARIEAVLAELREQGVDTSQLDASTPTDDEADAEAADITDEAVDAALGPVPANEEA